MLDTPLMLVGLSVMEQRHQAASLKGNRGRGFSHSLAVLARYFLPRGEPTLKQHRSQGQEFSVSRRLKSIGVGIAAAAVAMTAAVVPAQAVTPAGTTTCKTPPANIDGRATAKGLTITFLTLLQSKDRPGLKAFLDPAFISVDSKGVAKTRNQLANGLLPNIKRFKVSALRAELNSSILTAHYLVLAVGDLNGTPYSINAAPRLSTFTFCSGKWQIVSHSIFDPLRG